MATSLSAAAHGVFAAEASLTNRSGKFTIMKGWTKPSEEPSTANCNDCEHGACGEDGAQPMDAKINDRCHEHAESKVSPRSSKVSPRTSPRTCARTPDHEPDAEPGTLESPRPDELRHVQNEMEKRHGEEVRSLTAQLMDAREQVERLKTSQQKLSSDVATERKGRKEAEDLASKLESKCHLQEQGLTKLRNDKNRLCQEKAGLEKKVQQLRRIRGSNSSCQGYDFERLAIQMAETECGPLSRCTAEDKVALKKKLLLKWHPDKQPSAEHSHFATRVVQEMQNNAIWQD